MITEQDYLDAACYCLMREHKENMEKKEVEAQDVKKIINFGELLNERV